jgi:hypothetical protein
MIENQWHFNDKWSKTRKICMACGMVLDECICHLDVKLDPQLEFCLLVHPEEFKRTSNTGRLIKKTIPSTRVFKWDRLCPPKGLLDLLNAPDYQVYLVMAADKEEEKKRQVTYADSDKKIVFLILDGTWKEVRKILRKSPYLDTLPIIAFEPDSKSAYDLRRSSEDHHICTVETAILLLKLKNEREVASGLEDYYHTFLKHFESSKQTKRKST